MAYSPIAFTAPNYRDYKNNWIKAYEPGTTTPKAMATDSALSAFISKAEINKDGFMVSAGDALIIPYIEDTYDLWMFPTATEADNDDTSNALRLADNMNSADVSLINDLSQAYEFATWQMMVDSLIAFPAGKVLRTVRRKAGFSGGGASYTVTSGASPESIGSPDLVGGGYALLKIKDGEIRPEPYGAVGDVGDGAIDTPALQAAYTASIGKKLKLIAGKEYFINTSQAFRPESNTTVELNGAKLTVPVGATIVDPVGDGGVVYENGLWHLPVGGSADNFKIKNGRFEVKTEKIGLLTLGSATATIGDIRRKNIGIKKITASATLLTSTFLFWANACDLKVIENEVADMGFFCTGSENSGLVKDNEAEFLGVTRDFVTWNNASGIRMNGARGINISNNNLRYTGGTCITVRAAASFSNLNIIAHNEITGAGLTAISASNTAGGGAVKKVHITNNIINGYLCAVSGVSHGGIDVGGAAGAPSITEELIITNNTIDYLCFDEDGLQESFNSSTNWSEGGKNTLKQAGSSGVGSSSAINLAYIETNNANGIIVSNNSVRNYQNQSIRVEFCKFPHIVNNTVSNGGWERTAGNAPIVNNSSIRVENCLGPKIIGNTVNDACLGCSNTFGNTVPFVVSRSTAFTFTNNTYITNDGSHNQHAFTIVGGGAPTDSFDLFGYTGEDYVGTVGMNLLFAPGLNKYNILSGSNSGAGGGDLKYTLFDNDLNRGVPLFIPPTLGMYERLHGLVLPNTDVAVGEIWNNAGVVNAGTL